MTKNLAFYLTNELANEGLLVTDIPLSTIENIIEAMISEFDNQKQDEPSRCQSVKVHWKRSENEAWCRTLAKNPRLTTISDLVTCRRCTPEAQENKRKRDRWLKTLP